MLSSITKDVAKGSVVTEEKVSAPSQYLDLIYTQSGTPYEKIPNVSQPNFTGPPSPSGKDIHVGDGVIGSASTPLAIQPSVSQLNFSNQTPISSDPMSSSEIHVVSYDKGKSNKKPRSKKKGKDKKKSNSLPQEKSSDSSWKPHYPCLICNEDHFM